MKYLLIVLFLFVVGCSPQEKPLELKNVKEKQGYNEYFIEIKTIGGCEYIIMVSGRGAHHHDMIIHKQNCKFCKQRNEYPN